MVGGVLFTALWYRTYDGRRKERKVRSMTKPSFIYARQSRATRCRRALRKSITARKNTTSSSIDERAEKNTTNHRDTILRGQRRCKHPAIIIHLRLNRRTPYATVASAFWSALFAKYRTSASGSFFWRSNVGITQSCTNCRPSGVPPNVAASTSNDFETLKRMLGIGSFDNSRSGVITSVRMMSRVKEGEMV